MLWESQTDIKADFTKKASAAVSHVVQLKFAHACNLLDWKRVVYASAWDENGVERCVSTLFATPPWTPYPIRLLNEAFCKENFPDFPQFSRRRHLKPRHGWVSVSNWTLLLFNSTWFGVEGGGGVGRGKAVVKFMSRQKAKCIKQNDCQSLPCMENRL